MFIWLPKWFKNKHPVFARNLRENRNRLTSPYDIHITLKHIFELSGRSKNLSSAVSCPDCQTVLQVVPWNRSCSDAGISPHWCVCSAYKKAEENDIVVKMAAQSVIDSINKELMSKTETATNCSPLYLKKIILAMKSESNDFVDYVVKFDVLPSNARFESTVRLRRESRQNSLEIVGGISRLNEYGRQANCVNKLRRYCFCRNSVLNFASSIINWLI